MKDLFLFMLVSNYNITSEIYKTHKTKSVVDFLSKDPDVIQAINTEGVYFLRTSEVLISLRENGKYNDDIKVVVQAQVIPDFFVELCEFLNVEIVYKNKNDFNLDINTKDFDSSWYRFVEFLNHIDGYENIYTMDVDMWMNVDYREIKIPEHGVLHSYSNAIFPYFGFRSNKEFEYYSNKVKYFYEKYKITPMPSFIAGKSYPIKHKFNEYASLLYTRKYSLSWGLDTFLFSLLYDEENDDIDRKLEASEYNVNKIRHLTIPDKHFTDMKDFRNFIGEDVAYKYTEILPKSIF